MAVYNGGIRFAQDVYYEIKEDSGEITVLRNEEEIGGGSGALIVNVRYIEGETFPTLDRTWQEIYDAFSNNIPVFIKYAYNGGADDFSIVIVSVAVVGLYEGKYLVHSSTFVDVDGTPTQYIYLATQPNDYPTPEI